MKKRISSFLLALLMVVSAVPVMATAAVAVESEATLTADDLYVTDGLTGLFTAYGNEAEDNLDLSTGVWKNRVGTDNATVTGGAHNGTVGWKKADKGFYYDLTRANFNSYRNVYGVMLPLALLTDNDHALELVFDYRGLDGVNMNEDADGYGLRATQRSSINFAGFHMAQFHASAGKNAAGLESRFFYAPSAFENGVGDYAAVNSGGHLAVYSSIWMFSKNGSRTEFVDKTYTISINRNTSWRGEAADYRYVAYTLYLNNVQQSYMDNHTYVSTGPDASDRHQVGGSAAEVGVKYDRMYHTVADLTEAWKNDDIVKGGSPFEAFYGMPATVYAVRIYNRTLSIPERNQNHFADLCAYFGEAVNLSAFSALTGTMKDYVYTLCADVDFTMGVSAVNEAIAAATAKNVVVTDYDALYVQAGLVMLLSAFGSDTASADIAGGVWYNKAENGTQNAIISNRVTDSFAGWGVLAGGKGGIGYTMSAYSTASRNTYIDLSGVLDGTCAYTVEYTGKMVNGTESSYDTHTVNNKLGHWGDWLIGNAEVVRTLYNETDLNTNYFNCKGMVGQSQYIVQSGISTFTNVIVSYPTYSTRSVYVNTVQYYSQRTKEFWGNPTKKLDDPTPTFFLFRNMNATVYSIRVYDRALDQNEMDLNHFVDLCAYAGADMGDFADYTVSAKYTVAARFKSTSFESADKAEIEAVIAAEREIGATTEYDELYVQDGLSALFTAYEGEVDLANYSWYSKVGDSQIFLYDSSTVTDWTIGEGGKGVGYSFASMKDLAKNLNTIGMRLPTSLLNDGDMAIEYVFQANPVMQGDKQVCGVKEDKESTDTVAYENIGNGYPYGIYNANPVSSFSFGGLNMCQFHWVDYDGASASSRFYYANGSWENFGGDAGGNRNLHSVELIGNKANGINDTVMTLTFNRTVSSPAEDTDYNRVDFQILKDGASISTISNQKGSTRQKTFYTVGQLNSTAEGYDANHAFFALPSVVYAIRMYDRTLTEAEMKQNHAVDLMAYFKLDVEGFAEASEVAKAAVYDIFASYGFDADMITVIMMQKAIDRAAADTPVSGLGFQTSTDGKDLRILGALDYTENVSRVGFVITFKQNGEVVKTFGTASADNTTTVTKTVFDSITIQGQTAPASYFATSAFYAAVVKNVPAGEYDIEVVPFCVDMDGNVVTGDTETITITFGN